MEVVSVSGQDSQHFTSQETVHLASHDFPTSIHSLPHDHPPPTEDSTPHTPSPRAENSIRHVDMASSSSFPSIGSPGPASSQFRNHDRGAPQVFANPHIDGQDHDRMETDEESDDSDSGVDTPQNEETTEGGDLVMTDAEVMDTFPDGLEEGEVQQEAADLPSQAPTISTNQPPNTADPIAPNDALVEIDNLPATASDGDQMEGSATSPRGVVTLGNESASTQTANMEASTSSNHIVTPEEQTGTAVTSQAVIPPSTDAPPSDIDPPNQPGENGESDSSSEEEEHPYWADFEEDQSVPNDDELKQIEQQPSEPNALSHDDWEKLAFEPLDDPEYLPSATGRISWTLKGFHGTPSKPNKEEIMRSPSVLIDGYYWNIKVFPRGNEGSSLMSVYIECSTSPRGGSTADDTNAVKAATDLPTTNGASATIQPESNEQSSSSAASGPTSSAPVTAPGNEKTEFQPTSGQDADKTKDRWEMPAQILCVAYNPEEPRVLASDRSDHRFFHDSPDWGWRRFHGPWNKLHRRQPLQRQALLRNDTLCFTAYIRTLKDHTGALFWHAPEGQPQWDHFERLGLNRMLAGSWSSGAAVSALVTWLYLYPVSSTLQQMSDKYDDEPWRYNETPLTAELEHLREDLRVTSRRANHSVSITNSIDMIGWYTYALGDCDPDIVGFWEALRRVLSFEASNVKSIGEAKDTFSEILLLKQPDAGKRTTAATIQHVEPCSVQGTVDLAMSYKELDDRVWQTFDGLKYTAADPPAVLQVELHRQQYDATSRKWEKLTHFIELDETISFALEDSALKQGYTLFGTIIHSGSLESKEYCSILRPEGPGTRWIKYAADKAERGVECLTAKQAITSYEGENGMKSTSPVAYVATYVRTDLLESLAKKSEATVEKAVGQSEIPSGKETLSIEPMDQDGEEPLDITVRVYQSDLFEGQAHFGIFDWSQRGVSDSRVLEFDVDENITASGLIDLVVEKRKEKFPDGEGKYAMWFMDTLLNNNVMEDVLRAPQLIPATDKSTNELLKLSNLYYGTCRIWLHVMPSEPEKDRPDSQMLDSSTTITIPNIDDTALANNSQMPPPTVAGTITDAELQSIVDSVVPPMLSPPPPESPPAPLSAEEIEALSVETTRAGGTDEPSPEAVPDQTAPATSNGEVQPRDTAEISGDQPPSQSPIVEGGDTVMVDNGEAETELVTPPPPAKPTWNSKLDKMTLMDMDNNYIFLKTFDPETQSLRGVKCFFTRSTEKIGKTLRSELSLAENQPIDVYEEKINTIVRSVNNDSRFSSIGNYSTILIVQRRPSVQELSLFKQSGKPATVPDYYEYLLSTTDPAYRQPHLTTSYFSTPYYSGALAYGRPHGQGTSIALSGDAYNGTFASGQKRGHGVMRYANGDTYTGSWLDDEPEGQGEMVYAKTGNRYTGGFKKRKRYGKGVMHFEVADEEQKLCQICFEEEADAMFYDCGHVTACETCARQVDDCPVCRRRVKAVCKIWMS